MGRAKLSGKSGVYIIKNTIDSRVYIGSSLDIYSRFQSHKKKLKVFQHTNSKLNNFCKKYGYDKFIFEVLELCDKQQLLEFEQKYMDKYKSYDLGFNISKTATYPYKDLTEEEIRKRRITFAEKRGLNFYAYNKSFKEYHFISLQEGMRTLKISTSKLSECLNKNKYHKEYVFSKSSLNKEEIKNLFNVSNNHFKIIAMKSIENISNTKSFNDSKSVLIHKHEIVDIKTALLLNNKVESAFVFNKNTKKVTLLSSINFNKENYIYAPTQSLLSKWLREKHNIIVLVDYEGIDGYYYKFYSYKEGNKNYDASDKNYNTYEEAYEIGLQEALKLI